MNSYINNSKQVELSVPEYRAYMPTWIKVVRYRALPILGSHRSNRNKNLTLLEAVVVTNWNIHQGTAIGSQPTTGCNSELVHILKIYICKI